MKTTLRYLHLNACDVWHRHVEEHLERLHHLTPINTAEVVLEHRKDATPAFRVKVQLEVPGPGPHPNDGRKSRERSALLRGPLLRGAGCDNTLEAALLKATQALEDQMQARKTRSRQKQKSQLQLSAISGRWTHAQPRGGR